MITMKSFFLFLAVLVLPHSVAVTPSLANEKSITIGDVAKVVGAPVKLVPRDACEGAGGDLNFALKEDGRLILMVRFLDGDKFKPLASDKNSYKAPVKGVGDEAFSGPLTDPQYILILRKGKQTVSLSTYFNTTGPVKEPLLTTAQLAELGRVIASRL